MSKQVFEYKLGRNTFVVEVGYMAKQASGSALVRFGDTTILSTVTASKQPKDLDFFPLTVSFEERLYAVGKIPGSFLRREGRPSENAILISRLIDRPIRPLFPDGFRNEVQIVNMVLSVDSSSAPEVAALFGSSLSLMISDVPFDGPVAGVIVGLIDNKLILNPTSEELEKSALHLVVAGTETAINMVESGSSEISEEQMLEAIMFGHDNIKKLISFQKDIASKVGKPKREIKLYEVEKGIREAVEKLAQKKLVKAVAIKEKLVRYGTIDTIMDVVVTSFTAKDYADEAIKTKTIAQVKIVLHDIVKDEVRRLITVEKIRPDGRHVTELRPLSSQVDLLPRVHGSAMFTRGETQVMSICTLGTLKAQQIIDNLTEEEGKRFMHHYNFPPFSVGEVGRMGSPGRREIGHGALGERALLQVIPDEKQFPYTIRIVSEVLESNGSTSQASICASTMALMAAGVPISAPVAGIAMGLIANGDVSKGGAYTILTDIQGMEDHLGDMDFKVAGTAKGICALQMDIKIKGINREILQEALAQAKIGRQQILKNMSDCISAVRPTVSTTAPKIHQMYIPIDKIRDVIGAGGKIINEIIEKCNGVEIDIEQDGRVIIYHSDLQSINLAKEMIEKLTKVAAVGEIYEAKVVRIEAFGAFVELFPGADALVHVSKIAHERVAHPKDVLKIGDVVQVIVTEIDDKGRVNASRKDLLPKVETKPETEK